MNHSLELALLLSSLIGVSLGLFGGGGSVLAVPVLVYVAGLNPKAAVVMSLAIVGSTSLMACLMHRRNGNVDLRVALVFGASGMFGAYGGAKLTYLVSDQILLLLFALFMLLISTMMFFRGNRQEKKRAMAETKKRQALFLPLFVGFVVGGITGFLGMGGGFIIVPALVIFAGLPMHLAIGTSLFVIFINALSGLTSHLGKSEIPFLLTLAFTVIAIVGSLIGTRLSKKISPEHLRKGFAVFIFLVGLGMVAKNSGVFGLR